MPPCEAYTETCLDTGGSQHARAAGAARAEATAGDCPQDAFEVAYEFDATSDYFSPDQFTPVLSVEAVGTAYVLRLDLVENDRPLAGGYAECGPIDP